MFIKQIRLFQKSSMQQYKKVFIVAGTKMVQPIVNEDLIKIRIFDRVILHDNPEYFLVSNEEWAEKSRHGYDFKIERYVREDNVLIDDYEICGVRYKGIDLVGIVSLSDDDRIKVREILRYYGLNEVSAADLIVPGRLDYELKLITPIGLRNLNNTCFMNSALQILVNIDEITQYFVSKKYIEHLRQFDSPHDYFANIWYLFAQFYVEGTVDTYIVDFYTQVTSKIPQFGGYGQHDSLEYLMFLINNINNCFIDGNPLEKILYGSTETVIECILCKVKRSHIEPFLYICLEFPQKENRARLYMLDGTVLKPDIESFNIEQIVLLLRHRYNSYFIANVAGKLMFTGTFDHSQFVCFYEICHKMIWVKFSNKRLFGQETLPFILPVKYCDNEGVYCEQIKNHIMSIAANDTCLFAKDYDQILKDITSVNIRKTNEATTFEVFDSKYSFEYLDISTKKCYKSLKNVFTERSSTLGDCVDRFLNPEIIGGPNSVFCETCRTHTESTKMTTIKKTGIYLIFVIKRYIHSGTCEKIDIEIKCPDSIFLNGERYLLFGYINHFGSMKYGHYTACINIDNKWMCLDDLSVHRCSRDTKNAYAYVYRRI